MEPYSQGNFMQTSLKHLKHETKHREFPKNFTYGFTEITSHI